MIDKDELLEIYIREMTKYMTYENSLKAREDFLYVLESNIGKNYDNDELKDYLQKLGSPYSLGSHYRNRNNIIITGKISRILNKFLITFLVSLILSLVLALILKSGLDKKGYYFFDLSKTLLFTIFFSTVFNAWISEKVKDTKIIKSLLNPFDIKDLYSHRSIYTIQNSKFIIPFIYSFIIFMSIYMEYDIALEKYIFAIQIAFFLLILRDFSRFSEGEYGKYVTMVKILTNVIVLFIFIYFLKNIITFKLIRIAYYLLVLLSIFDLLIMLGKLR